MRREEPRQITASSITMKICLLLLTVAATALAARLPHERAAPLDRYLSLTEANAWIDGILAAYPSVATAQSLGTSSEGRDIRAIKISSGGSGKPVIYVDSLIHSHEWITLPATLNLISELTENSNALLDSADFYIVPIVNPDGYEYAFTTDATWRKNRQSNPGSTCVGVDPNRNFDIHFNEGGNNDPCSTDYPGASATSTAETIAVSSFLSANPVSAFISLHSFGSFIVYSPAYSTGLPPTDAELRRVGTEASNAVAAVDGASYTVGPTGSTVSIKYGQAVDFAYEGAGVPLAYTFELTTEHAPVAARIPIVAAETLAAISAVVANAVPRQ